MDDDVTHLSDLAELILAIARLIQSAGDQTFPTGTPIEISVLRFINHNPGTSARAASEATLLTSSNFSRVLRGLEERGFVNRTVDPNDARRVRLYPTALATETRRRLGEEWYRLLGGIEADPAKIDHLIATLQRIEGELVSRRRQDGAPDGLLKSKLSRHLDSRAPGVQPNTSSKRTLSRSKGD